jgi:hypothetical protein
MVARRPQVPPVTVETPATVAREVPAARATTPVKLPPGLLAAMAAEVASAVPVVVAASVETPLPGARTAVVEMAGLVGRPARVVTPVPGRRAQAAHRVVRRAVSAGLLARRVLGAHWARQEPAVPVAPTA